MKKTFIKEGLLTIVAIFTAVASFAQTITNTVVTPLTVCAGTAITVTYTATGTFTAGNVFKIELSDAAGAFPGTVLTTTGTTSLSAVVPVETAAGALYKVRVVSTAPVVLGAASAVLAIKAAPAAPVTQKDVFRCEGAASLTLSATGEGLKWYAGATKDILPGAPVLGVAPGGIGTPTIPTFLVTQTVNGCESSYSEIYVINRYISTTPIVTNPADVCQNSTVTVDLLKNSIKDYDVNKYQYGWRDGATTTSSIPVPSTATVGSKDYFVTSGESMKCRSPEVKITVTVVPAPVAPTVANISYSLNAKAVALTATGTGLKWYDAASGGTVLVSAPIPLTTALGTKSYFVSQTTNGCESPRAEIVVTVTCPTPAPTVTPSVSYALNQKAEVLTATGTALKWYMASTGGSPLTGAPTPATTALGTISYYVSQTLDGCESPRAEIKVTVSACATPKPTVVSPVVYNAGAVATDLAAVGTGLKWYSTLTAVTALPAAPTPSTAVVGSTSYFVSQTLNGCEGPRAEIVVTINCGTPAPTTSAQVKYLVGATAVALEATGTGLKWYTGANGGTSLGSAPIPLTTTVGTTSYYVSQTLNGCEGPRAKIDVVVSCGTALPVVVTPVNYCIDGKAIALTAVGATLKWYATVDGLTPLPTAPVPATTAAGTTSYYVSQTLNGCEGPREKIDVIVYQTSKPVVTTPVSYCFGDTKATALTATGTALKWYEVSTIGGVALPGAPVPITTVVGLKSYFVSQTLNGCESLTAEIKVETKALPVKPTVTVPAPYCKDDSPLALVAATTAASSKLNWYGTNATGGTPSAVIPIPSTSATASYYVSQTDVNGCESPRAELIVTVKPVPVAPTVPAATIEYCQFAVSTALTATPQANAKLSWFGTNETGGTASADAPVPPTLAGGTFAYYVGQTLDGCLSTRAKINVLIKTTPKPTTTTSLAFCQGADAAVLSATGDNLKWYREANGTTSQPNPFTPFTQKVEDYSFFVTQTGSNGCESPKEEIKVHIKALPSATISGNTSIALGETAQIRVNFTSDGPWNYVLSNGVTGSTSNSSIDIAVKPSTTTTYVVTEVSNTCGKGIPVGSALVTVRIPTINTGNPSAAEICAGKTFQLPFQQSGNFPEGNKFTLQISTVNEDAKFVTIPSTATSSVITATVPDSTKGGAYFLRIVSSDSKGDFLVKGSVAGVTINVNPLPVATLSGTKTILAGQNADLKIEFIGKAPWTFNLYDGVKDSSITAPQTPFIFLVKPKATTSYTIRNITNVCGTVATGNGTARIQVDPILGIEPAVVNFVKVYPTIIETRFTVELDEPVSPKLSKIEVLDMSGRAMTDRKIKQKVTEMDLTNYPGGLYLIKVQNGNHSVVHRVLKK
jgi:hypothetical protein